MTVVGDAGVGKSRLVAEFLVSVEATVVRGRCLPYGEGITYWPVVEVLKQLDVLPADEAAAVAIRSLLGESEAATSAEEIAWAFRKTLEQAAAERPLVVVFDDIQWGEETFLDLIEHVALLSTGASILLLCMARSELAERRPTWPVTLRLEPLGDEDVDELIPERIAGELRERIARAAGGNPLFVEEMLAMAGEADGEVVVPPTLQALLAARLDQLEPAERSVLERGAIEGEIFHRGAVQALAPEETQVTPRLAALVRKELIRPDKPQLAGEDGFRFRHLLSATPPTRRCRKRPAPSSTSASHPGWSSTGQSWSSWTRSSATTSSRPAATAPSSGCPQTTSWPRRRGGAWRPAATARPSARTTAPLSACSSAQPRSYRRPSSTSPSKSSSAKHCSGQAGATTRSGAQKTSPSVPLRRAIVSASSAGGSRRACSASPPRAGGRERGRSWPRSSSRRCPCSRPPATTWLCTSPTPRSRRWRRRARRWTRRWRHYERAFAHARRAGHVPAGFWAAARRLSLLRHDSRVGAARVARRERATSRAGPLPPCLPGRVAGDARSLRRGARDPRRNTCGAGGARRGSPAREHHRLRVRLGRALGRRSRRRSRVRSRRVQAARGAGGTELPVGRGRRTWRRRSTRSTGSTRPTPGPAARRSSARATTSGTQMLWRQVRAKVLARRGEHAEAERLAREAVAICEETDMLDAQGDAYADLAEVLLLGGKADEAAAALEQALERYERKGKPRLCAARAGATRRASECSADDERSRRSGALLQSSPSRSRATSLDTTIPSPTEEAAILVTA